MKEDKCHKIPTTKNQPTKQTNKNNNNEKRKRRAKYKNNIALG